ncbi:MAG TPA: prolyl oligopeptidase family serine peptidase [Polyangiaceae bacterium]|nr:prolyl oligopeptidase family serine peptidase [Polyangiaceae bacterium]
MALVRWSGILFVALGGCGPAPSTGAAPALPIASGRPVPAAPSATVAVAKPAFVYPESRISDQSDVLHGVTVRDPYRWLEDADSEETKRWVEAQNRLTHGFLEKLPERPVIAQRLRELWDYERFDLPIERGGRYFYTHNSGLQNQSVLYWLPKLDAQPKLLLDPNTLSPDGTVALTRIALSEDGKLLAYGLSRGGSDWTEFHVRRVDDGKDLPDVISWSKFASIAWTRDGKGFFYSAYDEPKPGQALSEANYYNKLYFHRLGDKQSQDRLIYERRDQKKWGFGATATRDGRYVVVSINEGTDPKNGVLYIDLSKPKSKPVELVPKLEWAYELIGNHGSTFWFYTNHEAPRGRVVKIDVAQAKPEFVEVIPQRAWTLRQVERVGGKFVVNYLVDAHSELRVLNDAGKDERSLVVPGLGTASLAEGDDRRDAGFYSYESFYEPRRIMTFDVKRGSTGTFRSPSVKFEPAKYETVQVFYSSKDGTKVPMFITRKKGTEPGPKVPTLLYGYGGFSISITPTFSVANLTWLELGGVLAVPNLRGGGEYGEAWHEAGKLANKQNVFDDFIAAAEYLRSEKLATPQTLAIQGRSNGGLLVGAMLAQRPDLFGAALPGVGVMDMLRFHKFTIGWGWTDDYGSPDDAEGFKVLYRYSPLHNLRPGLKYPATLITTGDHDDRVVPAHSFKFAAALQHAQAGDAPVLIRIETRAGHGAGIPTEKKIEEVADQWAFARAALHADREENAVHVTGTPRRGPPD